MAIKIFDKFAPRANPADADYPHGSIKNESVPGAKDGTPLDAAWGNDYAGFDAALLAEAGIVPNGLPDTVVASQRLEAVRKISGRRAATVAQIENGDFSVGSRLTITDRGDAAFDVVAIGSYTANGFDILDAGAGKVAVLQIKCDVYDLQEFGVNSGDDLYAAAQRAINLADANNVGNIIVKNGDFALSQTLQSVGDNITIVLEKKAYIAYNQDIAIRFTGDNCEIRGGFGNGCGLVDERGVWDGTNVTPTYAVVIFEGEDCNAGLQMVNIKRVGVWFKDVKKAKAVGCALHGNYPSAQWTGVETLHVGILIDPTLGANKSKYIVNKNDIDQCVQGVLPANFGAGGVVSGLVVTGNAFSDCWNHGIYSIFSDAAVVVGNNFNRCQIPIALSGNRNAVTGNTLVTLVNVIGDERDVTGISVRDGSYNVISNNTIKGVSQSLSAIINIQDINGTAELRGNIVSDNTIEITGDNAANLIRIAGSTNPVNNNIVHDNTIKGRGRTSQGSIQISGPSGAINSGNKVHDNTIELTGDSYGVYFLNLQGSESKDNTVKFGFNAPSSLTVYNTVILDCLNCDVANNMLIVDEGFGTNLRVAAYREFGSSNGNYVTENRFSIDNTNGATAIGDITLAGSALIYNQTGVGLPVVNASAGSTWKRTDGGSGSTFYVKESSVGATEWNAK